MRCWFLLYSMNNIFFDFWIFFQTHKKDCVFLWWELFLPRENNVLTVEQFTYRNIIFYRIPFLIFLCFLRSFCWVLLKKIINWTWELNYWPCFFVLRSKETQVYRFLRGGHIAYIFFAARAQIDLFSMKTGNKIQA